VLRAAASALSASLAPYLVLDGPRNVAIRGRGFGLDETGAAGMFINFNPGFHDELAALLNVFRLEIFQEPDRFLLGQYFVIHRPSESETEPCPQKTRRRGKLFRATHVKRA